MTDITFTPQMRDDLRKAYDKAVAAGDESFMFEGNEYLTTYAKFLLDHLDNVLVPTEASSETIGEMIFRQVSEAISSGEFTFCLGNHIEGDRHYHLDVVITEVEQSHGRVH